MTYKIKIVNPAKAKSLRAIIFLSFLFVGGNNAYAVTLYGTTTPPTGTTTTADVDSVAIGTTVTAKKNAVAIGSSSTANGEEAIALGQRSDASTYSSIAIGTAASAVGNSYNTAIGYNSKVNGQGTDFSIALGGNTSASSEHSIAIGRQASVNTASSSSIAIGDQVTAAAQNTISIGKNANASSVSAIVIGSDSTAAKTALRSLALGTFVNVSQNESIAIGSSANSGGQQGGNITIGSNALNNGDSGHSITIGDHSKNSTFYGIAIGPQAETKSDSNAIAIGYKAITSGTNATSIGYDVSVSSLNGTSIGTSNDVSGAYSTSLGNNNKIQGTPKNSQYSIAIGSYNSILYRSGINSSDGAIAIGYNNTISHSQAIAIGNNIVTNAPNTIILGNNSSDSSADHVLGSFGRSTSAIIGNISYRDFAGTAIGLVSIGAQKAERQLINVAPGSISSTSTDAVNGSQLYSVANNVNNLGTSITNIIGGGATLGSDGSITYPTTDTDGIGGTGKTNIDDAIASINTATKNAKTTVIAGSSNVTVTPTAPNTDASTEYTVDVAKNLNLTTVTTGNTKVSNDGITIKNGDTSVSLTANGLDNGGNTITNVGNGAIGQDSKDAINGGQLYDSNKNIANIIGGNTAVAADGTITTSDIGGTGKSTIDEAIKAVQTAATNAKTTVVAGSANITVTPTTPNTDGPTEYTVDVAKKLNLESVTVSKQNDDGTTSTVSLTGSGLDNGGNKITNVANGDVSSTSQDAVNGSQLYKVQEKVNSPLSFAGDSGNTVERQLGSTINITGGVTDATKLTSGNIGVVADNSTNSLNIALAKNITGLESVTTKDAAGNQTIVNGGGISITTPSGNNVSLTTEGLNNGGNTITNIGAGVNDTDAVNVGQLNTVKNDVHQLSGEIDRVGALSAALGGLTPLQYDPLEPTQIMVAYGNYRSSQAIALGVARYLNDSTLIHGGIAYGGSSSYQSNIGVTWKIGSSDAERALPARYRNGVAASTYVLIDEVQALKVDNAKMHAENDRIIAENEKLQQQIQLLLNRVK